MKDSMRIDRLLTLLVLGLVLIGCFWVLQPFMTAIGLGIILTIAGWPLFLRLRTLMRGHGAWAAAAMVMLISAVVLMPFVIVGTTIAENLDYIRNFIGGLISSGPPVLPEWVEKIPLVGASIVEYWEGITRDTAHLLQEAYRLAEPMKNMVLSGGAVAVSGILQLALAIVLAFFFFRDGETLVQQVRIGAHRIAFEFGERIVVVTTATVRGVVLGILGTALAQGVVMALGLWIAGIKAAPLLGLLTFFLSPVPVGPPMVWVPVGLWLISQGEIGWGIFMFVWGAGIVSMIDNVLRPLIISQTGNLSFMMVLMGILGGIIAFGFIGVFLGPVLLAIGYMLLKEWVAFARETHQSAARQ